MEMVTSHKVNSSKERFLLINFAAVKFSAAKFILLQQQCKNFKLKLIQQKVKMIPNKLFFKDETKLYAYFTKHVRSGK